MILGKCPHCGQELDEDDIADYCFRGFTRQHFAYICVKCNKIIGFSSGIR